MVPRLCFLPGDVVRVKEVLRADKTIIDHGRWRSDRMPATQFPLRKGRRPSYMLGSAYRWRVLRFSALGSTFRALIAYRNDVEEYRAYIGREEHDGDTRLIFDLGYHGSHDPPGWHVHTTCSELEDLPSGVMRSPWLKRIPRGIRTHRRALLVAEGRSLTDSLAYNIFAKHARLPLEPIDLFDHGAVP